MFRLFTDLKVHDITNGLGDPNCEPLNMNTQACDPVPGKSNGCG